MVRYRAPGARVHPPDGPHSVQVAVIGAGYTGLSAALHLARAGRDVAVLESGGVGEGASGLNGGQVIPGLKHDPDKLEELRGPGAGRALIDTVAQGPAWSSSSSNGSGSPAMSGTRLDPASRFRGRTGSAGLARRAVASARRPGGTVVAHAGAAADGLQSLLRRAD